MTQTNQTDDKIIELRKNIENLKKENANLKQKYISQNIGLTNVIARLKSQIGNFCETIAQQGFEIDTFKKQPENIKKNMKEIKK